MEYEFLCKTFRCCIDEDCDNCPLYDFEIEHCEKQIKLQALAFIIRQQAEIERLQKESADKERAYTDEFCCRKEWQRKCRDLLEEKTEVKCKAVREFAERLKKWKYQSSDWSHGEHPFVVEETDIDELVIEMTEKEGGNNGTEDKH